MNNIDFLLKKVISHRGVFDNSLGIPENSLESFKKAVEQGYSIELDIHVLKDNTVVVFHDDNLKRMTGIDKKINTFTYEELKEIKLLNSTETIPTLEEVLELIDGKVPILIEFKSDGTIRRLEQEAMKILVNYKGKYAIQSFDPNCVYFFKKNYPNIPRGQLIHGYDSIRNSLVNLCLPIINIFTNCAL